MGRKRLPPKNWKITSFRIEQEWIDICDKYHIPITDAIKTGIKSILQSRIAETSEDVFAILCQREREHIQKHQDKLMYFERLAIDARIRDEVKSRKKTRTEIWEGKEVTLGVAE